MKIWLSRGVLAWLTLSFLSCTGGEEAGQTRVWSRLIEDAEVEEFDKTLVLDHEPVLVWSFASSDDRLAWKLTDLDHPRTTGRLLTAKVTGPRPRLERETTIDTDSTHSLKLSISGLRGGLLEVYWAGPGERFSPEKRMSQRVQKLAGREHDVYRFDLLSHPEWSGTIARVRFVLPASRGKTLTFEEISWFETTLDTVGLADALEKSWKFELDHDSRLALLCPPGTSFHRSLDVPADASLSFSYGLDPAVSQSVTFELSMARNGEDFETVFSGVLEPQLGQSDRWFTTTVPLDNPGGEKIRLRFETSSDSDLAPGRNLAAWSNIEVLTGSEATTRPNIVVILIDTLRADRLSAYGNQRRTSPNIDAWARDSAVLFENVVAQAPWTLPSHVSLFTGLDALRHGVNHNLAAPDELTTMAEILHREGYTTAAIAGGGFLRPGFGLAQGFDSFRYWPEMNRDDELADGIERALAWLDGNHDRRFFLFFHTYEVHGPHRRREPFFSAITEDLGPLPSTKIQLRERGWEGLKSRGDYFVATDPVSGEQTDDLTDREKTLVRGMYDSAIAYTDAQIQRILDRLDTLGLRDTTMVILTSDHGEALGENDRAGHHYLNEYNVLVPLIIEFPGATWAGARVADQVRLIDLLPTVFETTGVSNEEFLDGSSLLPLVRGEPSRIPNEAWTYASSTNLGVGLRLDNGVKYIFNNSAWSSIVGEEELYDLAADPAELMNRAADDPATPGLRQRTREVVLERHQGLRMEIRNASGGTLDGIFQGAWSKLVSVKSVDDECRCVHWRQDGAPAFSLDSGKQTTLLFEGLKGRRVTISGAASGPGDGRVVEFQKSFSLDGIDKGVGYALTGSKWRRVADREDVETGFWLWSVGGGRLDGEPEEPSAELLDQLRALGYVE